MTIGRTTRLILGIVSALILAFIGVKLVLHWAHGLNSAIPEIPIGVSLGVILGILAVTVVASLIKVRRDPASRAHAGSVSLTRPAGEPPADKQRC